MSLTFLRSSYSVRCEQWVVTSCRRSVTVFT